MTQAPAPTLGATAHPIVTPIVALDVPDRRAAQAIVTRLGAACGYYKVGLELFAAEGPEIVSWLRDAGKLVFVDLKLHDIPNTVRGAARSVARHGASLLTVHASGGSEMIRAAVAGAQEGAAASGGCGVLGVTILTSMDSAGIGEAWGREEVDVTGEVLRLAGQVAQLDEGSAAARNAIGFGVGNKQIGIDISMSDPATAGGTPFFILDSSDKGRMMPGTVAVGAVAGFNPAVVVGKVVASNSGVADITQQQRLADEIARAVAESINAHTPAGR